MRFTIVVAADDAITASSASISPIPPSAHGSAADASSDPITRESRLTSPDQMKGPPRRWPPSITDDQRDCVGEQKQPGLGPEHIPSRPRTIETTACRTTSSSTP